MKLDCVIYRYLCKIQKIVNRCSECSRYGSVSVFDLFAKIMASGSTVHVGLRLLKLELRVYFRYGDVGLVSLNTLTVYQENSSIEDVLFPHSLVFGEKKSFCRDLEFKNKKRKYCEIK